MEVRILLPKPFTFEPVVQRNRRTVAPEATGRRFESCRVHFHADVAQRQEALVLGTRGCEFDSHRRYQFLCRSGGTEGDAQGLLQLCENVTRAGESPAFDTIFQRVGDVIDSIEVLQTSCEGLNPSRSTKFLFAGVAQTAEAVVSKTIQVQVRFLPRVFSSECV